MTALPEPTPRAWLAGPDHLLTITEYAQLGESESGYTELIEGRIMMSPSPTPKHNIAVVRLFVQLEAQLPTQLAVVPDVDVDLALAVVDAPGFSRRPDLIVVRRAALDRIEREGGILRADEVIVAIEIVSPGSRRIDYTDKHREYADAGIPHYWIVDLGDPVSLVDCTSAGEFGYRDAPAVTGTFTATEPFDVRIDLGALA